MATSGTCTEKQQTMLRIVRTQDDKQTLAAASQVEALRRIIKSLRRRIHKLEKPKAHLDALASSLPTANRLDHGVGNRQSNLYPKLGSIAYVACLTGSSVALAC